MLKLKCNAKTVATYMLMCEQMENEGVFKEFSKADYEKLIDYSLSKFKGFKDNFKEYENRTSSFNDAFPVNVISKYPMSSLEYKEERDSVDIGDGTTSILSKFDLFAEVEQFEFDRTGDGGKVDSSVVGYQLSGENSIIADEIATEEKGLCPFIRKLTFNEADLGIKYKQQNVSVYEEFYAKVLSELFENANDESIGEIREVLSSEELRFLLRSLSEEWVLKINEDKYKDSFFEENIETAIILGGHPILSDAIGEESISDTFKRLSYFMVKDFLSKKEVYELFSKFIPEKHEDSLLLWEQRLGDVIDDSYESTLKNLLSVKLKELYTIKSGHIVSLFENLQKGRVSDLENSLSYWLSMLGENNQEIVEMYFKNQKKENLFIEIEMRKSENSLNIINTIPIAKGKTIRRARVELFNDFIDGLDSIKKESVPIERYSFKIQPNKKISSIELKSIQERYDGKILPQYLRNDGKGMYRVDTKRALEKGEFEFSTIILDEADAAAKGNLAFVIRNLSSKAKNIVVATGTPIAGKAKYIVPMLAYSGDMRGEDVERNEAEFMSLCGIYEMKSKLLARLIASSLNKEYLSGIETFYDKYRSEKAIKNANLFKVVEDGIRQYVIKGLIELGLAEKRDFEDLEIGGEVLTFSALMDSILEREEDGAVSNNFYGTLISSVFGNFRLVKEVPGLSSVSSFTSLVKSFGGSQTIISRSGIMNRDESIEILDKATYNDSKDVGFENIEEYLSCNNGGARVVQSAVRGYVVNSFAIHVEALLKKNFRYFLVGLMDKSMKKQNLKEISELLESKYPNMDFSQEYIYTSLQSTSSSKSDNFEGIYKEYLLNNGDLERTTSEQMPGDKKREAVFSFFLEMYDSFLTEGIKSFQELESKGGSDNIMLRIEDRDVNISKCNYSMPEAFKRLEEDLSTREVVNSVENGFPNGWLFSADIDLCPVEYRYLMRADDDGKYIPYKLVFTREEDVGELLDIMAARKGVDAEIEKSIQKRDSMALASSRVIGTVLNLLGALDQNLKSSTADRKAIVLNLPAGKSGGISMGNIVERIKEEYKDGSKDVLLDAVPRSSMEKAMNAHIDSGSLVTLVTNYRSSARGLSLAPIDIMHITGATTIASDALQFRERQFSNLRTNGQITAYNGGNVLRVHGSKKEEEELVEQIFGGLGISELGEAIERALCDDTVTEGVLTSFEEPIYSDTVITKSSNNTNIAHQVGKSFMDGKSSTLLSAIKGINREQKAENEGVVLADGYKNIIKVKMEELNKRKKGSTLER